MALWFGSCALTLNFAVAVWSDDDWLKKFSGKTLEENTEEGGTEAPKAEVQEVGKATRVICILAVPKAERVRGQPSLEAEQRNVISTCFFLFLPRVSLLPRNPVSTLRFTWTSRSETNLRGGCRSSSAQMSCP